jgi:RHS repeat-associated protein
VLDEIQNGAVARTYSYGLELINERQSISGTLTTSFYGYDGHGSVRFLTDSTGAITDTYDYDAYGNLISSTGSTPNNYLFAGEQFDPALGIYYNRARYYDQRQGRFWTMDEFERTIADPISLHKYLYAAADPTNHIDPSGHDFSLGGLSISVAISATLNTITHYNANQTLKDVAANFAVGAVEGAAFYFAGGALLKILARAGAAIGAARAVSAGTQFFARYVARMGPLYAGLELPQYFSILTDAGEVFIKQNGTKHLAELLSVAGDAGATKLAASLAIEETKAIIEAAASQGLDQIAGKGAVTLTVGGHTVEIAIERQVGQAVQFAVTHLLFRN